MERINVGGVFTNGNLLRVGDFALYDYEYLNTFQGGFCNESGHGFIKNIYAELDSICNSCYTDLGLYSRNISYFIVFEGAGVLCSWEVYAPRISGKAKWLSFLNNFYNHELNSERKDRLIEVLGIPKNRSVVHYIKKENPEVYEFLIETFKVRFETPGLNRENYSKKMFSALNKYELTNTNSIFHKLTHK